MSIRGLLAVLLIVLPSVSRGAIIRLVDDEPITNEAVIKDGAGETCMRLKLAMTLQINNGNTKMQVPQAKYTGVCNDSITFSWYWPDGAFTTTENPEVSTSTGETTTEGGPTTEVQTTEGPITEGPTTEGPTTVGPTTEGPTTEGPTTEAPTTEGPTTEAPTTEGPTTEAPTTEAPITEGPTTEAPTTVGPTTEAPTTEGPTTEGPTTEGPTTEGPTTEGPTTEAPTTEGPTTEAPTTEGPTTEGPTTEGPTTEGPTTVGPTTEGPTTEGPTTEAPTTEGPTTEAPTTEGPTTEAPTTEGPTTEAPTTEAPITEGPTTEAPITEGPTTEGATTGGPTNVESTNAEQTASTDPSSGSIRRKRNVEIFDETDSTTDMPTTTAVPTTPDPTLNSIEFKIVNNGEVYLINHIIGHLYMENTELSFNPDDLNLFTTSVGQSKKCTAPTNTKMSEEVSIEFSRVELSAFNANAGEENIKESCPVDAAPEEEGDNTVAIAVGTTVGVVAVAGVAGFIFYRHRRRNVRSQQF